MMMMIEPEFDRYSQRSYRSTSTVQRSKYHTVSNDFVECTRPSAPTPVPNPLQITSSSSNGTTKTAAVVAAAAAPNYRKFNVKLLMIFDEFLKIKKNL